jgi:branched-chain amino acid transport system permease protein
MGAYLISLGILICINGILAVTLNFIMGYAGIYSMAHGVLYGVSAYAAALIALHVSPSFELAVAVAMVVTTIVSVMVAGPAIRVRGEYFVAASLGLQMVSLTIFTEWKSVTGGIGGLTGIPAPTVLGFTVESSGSFFILSLACLLLVTAIIAALVRSRLGRSLQAIRDSEVGAAALGKHVASVKIVSVAISSCLCAFSGALLAFYVSFINVESFTLEQSVFVMAMVVIGGVGTISGPIVGAFLLVVIPAFLTYVPFIPAAHIGTVQQVLYGLAMVLLMLFRPAGIIAGRQHGTSV